MLKPLLSLFLLLSIITPHLRGQSTPPDTSDFPYWIDMMADPKVNFYDTRRAFETYWTNRPIEKGSGYKPFKRWEYNSWEIIDSAGNIPPPGTLRAEVERFMRNYRLAFPGGGALPGIPGSVPCLTTGNWKELGPTRMPVNNTSQPNGLGRINALAFHPSDSNLMYAGAPAGGLWITTDGGQNWATNTDTLVTLGVSAIAIDPVQPDTIYLGTGDRDASDSYGRGVLKSTDGGQTWSSANSGMGNVTVGRLIIDPVNRQIILAATSSGLYRSTNGAGSWTRVQTGNFKELVFNPINRNYVYAASGDDFWRSTDNGLNWANVTNGLPAGKSRMVIGVTPADSQLVYALVTNSSSFYGLYLSRDRGTSFTQMSDSPNIMDYSHLGTGTGGQAWYDLDIAVDPSNPNIVYSAGVNIFQSLDSGKTWKISAHWVGSGGASDVHADNHILEYQPGTNKLYTGNDGGVYYTADVGKNWTEVSEGLGIAQIYRIGQSALSPDLLINGYQDNGTGLYNNGTWYTIMGGDGMDCVIDPRDDTWAYSDLYYGDIRRYKNNAYSGIIAKNGTNGINESGGWITPFILRESDGSTMFAGYKNVWRSTNVKATSASSVTWTKISNNLGGTNGQNITVLENSSVDDNLLYMARADNKLFKSADANATTPTWTDLTSSLPSSGGIMWLETDRKIRDRLWLCRSNKIYQSDDGGSNWTDISSNLPNLPVLCVLHDSSSKRGGIYAGTYMGVFYKDTTMTNWVWFNDNMPTNTRVRDIEIYYSPAGRSKSHVVCGTYGRGNWRSPLYDEDQLKPVAGFKTDRGSVCQYQSLTLTDTSAKTPTRWLWEITPNTVSYLSGTDSCSQHPVVRFNAKGKYTIKQVVANCAGQDSVEKIDVVEVFDPIASVNCKGVTTTIGAYGIGVYGVNVAGFNHTSSGPDKEGGYLDRACTEIIHLKTDTAYFATITTGTTYNEYVKVFIDFNNNGNLNDAGEMVFDGPRQKTTHQDSIRIPINPVTNTLLRMRVMSDFDTIPANACDTLRYGQNEDFGVVIEPRVPTPHFAIDTNRICKNGRIVLTDSSSGSIYKRRWYVSRYGLLTYKTDAAGPVTFILPDTGWYYAELVLNDSQVSKRIDSIVYVQPVPSGSLGLSKGKWSSCESDQVVMTNNGSPSNLVKHRWYKNGVKLIGDTLASLTRNNLAINDSGTYHSEIDWNGCVLKTASSALYVNPGPKAGFTPNQTSACFLNNAFAFTNTSTISSGTLSYNWNFGQGSTATTTHPSFSYSDTGTFNVSLIATSNNGCKDTVVQPIRVNESPVAGFSINNASQCFKGHRFNFTNNSSIDQGNLTYGWSFGDGNAASGKDVSHQYASSGPYTVRLISTSNNGCRDTIEQPVTLNPSPVADFSVTAYNTCGAKNRFDFTNNSSITSGTITGYLYDFDDGTTSFSPTVNGKSLIGIGGFNVSLVATSNMGCRDTADQDVDVFAAPTSLFTHNAPLCFNGHQLKLTNISSVSTGTISGQNWDFGDGNTSLSYSPPNHTYTTPGNKTIRLVVISDNGCSDTSSQNIDIWPSPVADFTGGTGCVEQVINFVNQSTVSSGGLTGHFWTFGDGQNATSVNPGHAYSKAGTFEVKLVVTSDKGCTDSILNKTAAVVFDKPGADFSHAKVSSDGLSTDVLFNDRSNNAIAWKWTFGSLGGSTDQNPTINFSDTGTFQISLQVTNADGCTDSITKSVFIFPDVTFHFPNSFTPNGDNINEDLKPYGLGYVKSYRMQVFNRWGVKVFESTKPSIGWKGDYEGKMVLQGNYLVVLEYIDLDGNRGHYEALVRLIK